MPRPPLPVTQRRTAIVYVSLRPRERAALELYRRDTGQTLSQILREAFVASIEGRLPSWLTSSPPHAFHAPVLAPARRNGTARQSPRRPSRKNAKRR